MFCDELYVLVRTDRENCVITVKDGCGKQLFYGIAREKTFGFFIPRADRITVSARPIGDDSQITNYYSYLSPCTVRLVSSFRFAQNEPTQKFLLYDRNYLLPVPNATLTFAQAE